MFFYDHVINILDSSCTNRRCILWYKTIPKFKEIIIMYEINGLSYDEISNKLDIPIGTVKSRLYNAKKILAEELADLI